MRNRDGLKYKMKEKKENYRSTLKYATLDKASTELIRGHIMKKRLMYFILFHLLCFCFRKPKHSIRDSEPNITFSPILKRNNIKLVKGCVSLVLNKIPTFLHDNLFRFTYMYLNWKSKFPLLLCQVKLVLIAK